MELLSSINNSGIGAQYAVSAAKDVNGNEITSTYLTAVPEGTMNESSFGYDQGLITGFNGSAFSAGTQVDPNDFIPWSASGNFATSAEIAAITADLDSAYTFVAGSGISLTDDTANKTTTIAVTAQGGNPEVESLVTAQSGTWNTVTNKLNTTAFSTVSGNFLTAHQSLPSSANWNATYTTVNNKSAIWDSTYTVVNSNAANWNATYNTVNGNSATWNSTYDTVHDNSASWTGGGASVTSPRGTINVNGDEIEGTNSAIITGTAGGYETYLLANNSYIRPDPDVLINSEATFPQTGGTLVIPVQYGDTALYITITGNTNDGAATASGQLNTAENRVYIPLGEMHGPFTAQASYWANLSTITLTASAAPTTGIRGVGELAWNSALNSVRNLSATWNFTYNTVSTNSASWGGGSTYTGDAQGALDEVYTNSGTWNTVTDKLNTTAFSTVSGDFLTAHQTLANSANWDSTYTTVSTNSASWGAGSTYTGDAQGALDEVYTNSANWDASYDTLTANSAGWTSTRTTVANGSGNWNKAYSTVNGNSAAWGGSALPISAGPGVKMDVVDDTLVFSNDETVLWSGAGTSAVTLSEPYTNFEAIKICRGAYSDIFNGLSVPAEFRFWQMYGNNAQAAFKCAMIQCSGVDSTHITIMNTKTLNYNFTATSTQANSVTNNDIYAKNIITKVVGINRTASN